MSNAVPAEISVQLSQALNVIEHHLGSTLLAVHLYGSALDGGLKPCSDIDLLVTVTAQLDETVRQALFVDFTEVSASPGQSEALRALKLPSSCTAMLFLALSSQTGTAIRGVAAQGHSCGHLRARDNRC